MSAESNSDEKTQNTYVDIMQIKNSFYETNKKNIFFKNSQKFDCAREVCSKMDIVKLMDQTLWVVPDKNQFYFDYRVYKLYGNPDNFKLVIENVLHMIKWCITEYGKFEIHLNLSSFTVSAAERYKEMIKMFCDICMNQTEVAYLSYLTVMNIHNIPNVFEHISKILMPILPPELIPKLRLQRKEESLPVITQLYIDSGKIYTP